MKYLTIIFLLITSFALGQGAANGTSLLLRENSQTQIDGFQTQSGYVRLAWNDAQSEFQYRVGSGAWQSLATGGITWATPVNSNIIPDDGGATLYSIGSQAIPFLSMYSNAFYGGLIGTAELTSAVVGTVRFSGRSTDISPGDYAEGTMFWNSTTKKLRIQTSSTLIEDVTIGSGGGWVGTATSPLDMDFNPISRIGDMSFSATAVITLPAYVYDPSSSDGNARAASLDNIHDAISASTTGYFQNVDLSTATTMSYLNQQSNGLPVVNKIKAGTVSITINNIRAGQVNERYFIDVEGDSPVAEIAGGNATLIGRDASGNSHLRINGWGQANITETVDGVFKIDCSYCEWYTPNLYPSGNAASTGSEEGNSMGGWTSNVLSGVTTTYVQEGTYAIASFNTNNAGFSGHSIDITGLPASGIKTVTFYVNQVQGTSGQVRFAEEGTNTALATTTNNIISLQDTAGFVQYTRTIADGVTGFRLRLIHIDANPSDSDTNLDPGEEMIVIDAISITQ